MALKIGRALAVARQLDMLWENWRQLIALGFLEGNIVVAEGFANSSTFTVQHGLGRQPRGWLTLRAKYVVSHYEVDGANSSELPFFALTDGSDTHLTLLVY